MSCIDAASPGRLCADHWPARRRDSQDGEAAAEHLRHPHAATGLTLRKASANGRRFRCGRAQIIADDLRTTRPKHTFAPAELSHACLHADAPRRRKSRRSVPPFPAHTDLHTPHAADARRGVARRLPRHADLARASASGAVTRVLHAPATDACFALLRLRGKSGEPSRCFIGLVPPRYHSPALIAALARKGKRKAWVLLAARAPVWRCRALKIVQEKRSAGLDDTPNGVYIGRVASENSLMTTPKPKPLTRTQSDLCLTKSPSPAASPPNWSQNRPRTARPFSISLSRSMRSVGSRNTPFLPT